MKYRRMPIEIESPEQFGYDKIHCNLTESSVSDMTLAELNLDIDLARLSLAYTDHLGKPELRALIVAEGANLHPQDVIVTPSAAAALFIVATALLERGDPLLVMHPNYATNLETPRAIGCRVDTLDLRFEDGFRFDVDALAARLRPETKLISLTTPHNPTGVMLSEADLRAALALAEAHNCYLLVDETYRELAFAAPTPLAADLSPRAISVASMSKAYGLPGIRIGWIITRAPALQELFLAAKEQIFICSPVIDEEIAYHVLARKQQVLAPIRERNARHFAILKDWMAGQDALEWVEPSGGVVCFPRLRAGLGVDVDAFYRTLNERHGVFVGPGHWFGMHRRYMRIGYGWPRMDELEQGLKGISAAVGECLAG